MEGLVSLGICFKCLGDLRCFFIGLAGLFDHCASETGMSLKRFARVEAEE
jgi:hypothetical protein